MKLISLNVGLPRLAVYKGTSVKTGIFKNPVSGRVTLRTLNLDGDRQADLSVHGGPYKAVYAYPSEHYEYWRKELPGMDLPLGMFGENFTTEGFGEDELHVGDLFRVGSAKVMIRQPRMPCYKLALRFDRDDMIKRFLTSQRSGFYFSVIEEGEVQAGSKVEIMRRDPHRVAVVDIVRLYLRQAHDPKLLHHAMQVSALPQNWKAELAARVDHA